MKVLMNTFIPATLQSANVPHEWLFTQRRISFSAPMPTGLTIQLNGL
jgi:hypothetical protein